MSSNDQFGKTSSIARLGVGILTNPQDICFISNLNLLAVADECNGLVILSEDGKVTKHLKECSNAGSVCYNPTTQHLFVSISKSVSKGDETPNEIWIYDSDFKKIESLTVPSDPKVSPEYVRWITIEKSAGDVWLCTGDNTNAVLFKYSVLAKQWKLLHKQDGDLEHPCFIDDRRLAIISYRDSEDWKIKIFTLNDTKDKIVKTHIVNVDADTSEINEPWSLTVADDSTILAYDYKSGFIIPFTPPSYKARDFVAVVTSGQWVGLEVANSKLFISCSDERCVAVFNYSSSL